MYSDVGLAIHGKNSEQTLSSLDIFENAGEMRILVIIFDYNMIQAGNTKQGRHYIV